MIPAGGLEVPAVAPAGGGNRRRFPERGGGEISLQRTGAPLDLQAPRERRPRDARHVQPLEAAAARFELLLARPAKFT